jgi:hypothetical protein
MTNNTLSHRRYGLQSSRVTKADEHLTPFPCTAALLKLAVYAASHRHSHQWLRAIAILLDKGVGRG